MCGLQSDEPSFIAISLFKMIYCVLVIYYEVPPNECITKVRLVFILFFHASYLSSFSPPLFQTHGRKIVSHSPIELNCLF